MVGSGVRRSVFEGHMMPRMVLEPAEENRKKRL